MLTEISIATAVVCVCLLLHVGGMMLALDWLMDRRDYFEQRASKWHFSLVIIAVFSGIVLLHVAEASLWAVFYYSRSLFSDFETSLYFSLVSFGTIGYGDVLLPQRWRLLGAIEGISGALLAGLSAAFIFAIVNVIFQIRIRQRNSRSAPV
jgi:hypothetical protein